ncbi:MAG: Membrane protein, partial [Xanthobacteraceae bacterium]|nr:Membrane protein [Xanthobacteraceae bacterium]
MRNFLRNNGLSLALGLMFAISVAGMVFTGRAAFNRELADHGQTSLGLMAYLRTGEFLSALFENWESEFLQMATYVVLTAMLFQRGSSESRDPDEPFRPGDEVPWRARHPLAAWLYAHSLGLVLALLFIASFLLHWRFSMAAANAEALRHGGEIQTIWTYLVDPQLWFESFQNWQSEFLSTAVLVV